MIPARVILFTGIAFAIIVYISWLNSSQIEFVYYPQLSLTLSIAALVTVGFVAGVFFFILFDIFGFLRDLIANGPANIKRRNLLKSEELFKVANEYEQLGYSRKAIKKYQKGARLAKNSSRALLLVGKKLREAGLIDQAIASHKKLILAESTNILGYVELADDYLSATEYEKAKMVIDKAITMFGEELLLLKQKRAISFKLNQIETALYLTKKIIKKVNKTEVLDEKSLLTNLLFNRATTKFESGLNHEADLILNEIIDLNPIFEPAYMLKYKIELGEDSSKSTIAKSIKRSLRNGVIGPSLFHLSNATPDNIDWLINKIDSYLTERVDSSIILIYKGIALIENGRSSEGRLLLEGAKENVGGMMLSNLLLATANLHEHNLEIANEFLAKAIVNIKSEASLYICQNCSYEEASYNFRCSSCQHLNSFVPKRNYL